MEFQYYFNKAAILVSLIISLLACSSDDKAGDVIKPANSIADFVGSNPDYSTLNAALKATGLNHELAGGDNFTFFAPNNAAFNSFLSENGFSGLDAVPVDELTQLLLYHLQEGAIYSSDLSTGYLPSRATGEASEEKLSMYINTEDGFTINGVSSVTRPDIDVDNGVIHSVNSVLALPDITTFVIADPVLDLFAAGLCRDEESDLLSTLQMKDSPSPFTLFAPTNGAFVNLLEELELESLDELPSNVLTSILKYQIVSGENLRSKNFTDGMEVTTLEANTFKFNMGDAISIITDESGRVANVVAVDVQATNGVIHFINTVLLPKF